LRLDVEPASLFALTGGPVIADVVSRALLHDVLQTLVRWDERERRFEPELAKTWTISPDAKRVEFELDPDRHWHDGVSFDCGDVSFTFERLLDPGERVPLVRDEMAPIASFRCSSATTFVLSLAEPRATTLTTLSHLAILPRHVYGGSRVTDHPASRIPLGTGPYRLAQWIPGRELRLERSDPTGRVDRIRWRFVPSDAQALALARAGELDAVDFSGSPDPELDLAVPGFRRALFPRRSFDAIFWRSDRPPLDSLDLRRALAMRADVRVRPDGACLLPDVVSPYPADDPLFDRSLEPLSRDPRAAERTLDRLGFTRWDGKGFRFHRDRSVDSLRIEIVAFEASPGLEATRALHPQFEESGIKVRLPTLPRHRYRRLLAIDADAVLVTWPIEGPELDLYSLLHSSQAPPVGANFGRFRDAEVDRLLVALRAEVDPARRRDLAHRLQRAIRDEQPLLVVRSAPRTVLVSDRVEGYDRARPRLVDLWVRRRE
jgi:peptide/nickel transport system substrate-binding protein